MRGERTLDPADAGDARAPSRRRMVSLVRDLQFGWTVELETPSWEPAGLFAVTDEADRHDDRVRLVSDNGTVYFITLDESGGTTAPRLRAEGGRSMGVVVRLRPAGTVSADQDMWERVWQ
jgi:hypothetical protein